MDEKGNALSVLDRFELRCAEIPVADYPAFRADVEKAAAELDAAGCSSGPERPPPRLPPRRPLTLRRVIAAAPGKIDSSCVKEIWIGVSFTPKPLVRDDPTAAVRCSSSPLPCWPRTPRPMRWCGTPSPSSRARAGPAYINLHDGKAYEEKDAAAHKDDLDFVYLVTKDPNTSSVIHMI